MLQLSPKDDNMDSQHSCKDEEPTPATSLAASTSGSWLALLLCYPSWKKAQERKPVQQSHGDSKRKALHHTSLPSDAGKSSCETQMTAKLCIHSGYQNPGLLSRAMCSTAHKTQNTRHPMYKMGCDMVMQHTESHRTLLCLPVQEVTRPGYHCKHPLSA